MIRRASGISRTTVLLIDVNVLVYAHRTDAANHAAYRSWLEEVVNGDAAFGMSDLALSAFIRVVTHPRIFDPPTEIGVAVEAASSIRSQPNCVTIDAGPRHWEIFTRLCRGAGVKGSLVADAYFAALTIESGSEWVTTDRDYARFAGLRWRHPLELA
jgi:toxin-antitoxin system PIN domain toxin